MQDLAQVPGGFEPHRGWEYSTGANLLDGVLEVTTGETPDMSYEERFFGLGHRHRT